MRFLLKGALMLIGCVLTTSVGAQQPAAPPPAAASEAAAEKPRPQVEPPGFTWWNDIPELIRRGNEMLQEGEAATAADYYRDAQLRNPDEPVAAFNQGLARARQGEIGAAVEQFRNAADLAPKNRDLRQRAWYNMGVSQFEAARAAEKEKDRDAAVRAALDAIESFDSAIREGGPEAAKAEKNKRLAQQYLQQFAMPPPQQQQQQQKKGEGDQDQQQQQASGDQQQQQQQQQQPDENQQQDQQQQQANQQQQQQQGQDQQQSQDGQEQQDQQNQAGAREKDEQQPSDPKDEQGEDEKQDEQSEGSPTEQAASDRMTEEQARQLLNLVDDDKSVRLRKGNRARRDQEKDW